MCPCVVKQPQSLMIDDIWDDIKNEKKEIMIWPSQQSAFFGEIFIECQ